MYKKIYVEITNACNLNCRFCMHNRRTIKYMSIDEFKLIVDKIKGYIKYIYLHVLGEPLLNNNISEMINYAYSNGIFVNITTNGYLIDRLDNIKNIRQINISLHSFVDSSNKSLEEYMNDIFKVVDKLDNTYISYRLWVNNKYSKDILKILNEKYHTNFNFGDSVSFKFTDKIFLDTRDEFEWPADSKTINDKGTCYALRDHIGILVNGDIVPCCLDGDGVIKLGNIFNENLDDVINSKRYKDMLDGFKNNKKIEELCKKCHFIEK